MNITIAGAEKRLPDRDERLVQEQAGHAQVLAPGPRRLPDANAPAAGARAA
jgi:hypothetical protein